MTGPSRRTILSSTAGLLALSAGCLADGVEDTPDEDDADDPGNDDDADDPGSTDDETEALPDGLADYETQAYQYPTASTTSSIEVVRDADDATEWLEARSLSEAEALAEFVDGTDFETSILVSLESEAPSSCYELLLESIDIEAIEDGETDGETDGDETDDSDGEGQELVLEGDVRDTSADDEACTQSITTVGRLVRATFESEPLTSLSATVAHHDGSTSGASMRSDSASASEASSHESTSRSGSDGTSDDGS